MYFDGTGCSNVVRFDRFGHQQSFLCGQPSFLCNASKVFLILFYTVFHCSTTASLSVLVICFEKRPWYCLCPQSSQSCEPKSAWPSQMLIQSLFYPPPPFFFYTERSRTCKLISLQLHTTTQSFSHVFVVQVYELVIIIHTRLKSLLFDLPMLNTII